LKRPSFTVFSDVPKEQLRYSRTVPLFQNIRRDFIPFGNTHYNTISGSVNSKTQDIVVFWQKKLNKVHLSYYILSSNVFS